MAVQAAGGPHRPAARKEYLPARLMQLFGQLAAGLSAADDQHRT